MASCIFCKIIKGDIPSFKLFETEKTLAFMDIAPLSKGHALVIPKYHGAKLVDIPDEHLVELLPIAKKIATALGADNYNVLQNNGALANQQVDHVHLHVIPKPNQEEGLGVRWNSLQLEMDVIKGIGEELKGKISKM
ncbi:unnamed protein product [Discula destructiva]